MGAITVACIVDKFIRDGFEYEIVDMGEVNDHNVRYLVNYQQINGYHGGGAGLFSLDKVREYLATIGIKWVQQLTLGI